METVFDIIHRTLTELRTREVTAKDALLLSSLLKRSIPPIRSTVGVTVLEAAIRKRITGVICNNPLELVYALNTPAEDKSIGELSSTGIPITINVQLHDSPEFIKRVEKLTAAYPELNGARNFNDILVIEKPDDILYGLQVMYVLNLKQS